MLNKINQYNPKETKQEHKIYIGDTTLNIIYRFKNYEHLVFASDNCFYQLEHFAKRTKPFRKLEVKIYKGGKSILFNRNQVALSTLIELKVKSFEFVKIGEKVCEIPF